MFVSINGKNMDIIHRENESNEQLASKIVTLLKQSDMKPCQFFSSSILQAPMDDVVAIYATVLMDMEGDSCIRYEYEKNKKGKKEKRRIPLFIQGRSEQNVNS